MAKYPLPQRVVGRYMHESNRHDIAAILACLADDFVFLTTGSSLRLTKRDLPPVLEWDAALNDHASVRLLASDPSTNAPSSCRPAS